MNVVNATKDDINEWLKLAFEVEYLFGPMVEDPKFIQSLEKNIELNTAFCIQKMMANQAVSCSGDYYCHQKLLFTKLDGYPFCRKQEEWALALNY